MTGEGGRHVQLCEGEGRAARQARGQQRAPGQAGTGQRQRDHRSDLHHVGDVHPEVLRAVRTGDADGLAGFDGGLRQGSVVGVGPAGQIGGTGAGGHLDPQLLLVTDR